MKNKTLRLCNLALLGSAALICPAYAPALAQGQGERTTGGVIVELNAEGVNNPFLNEDNSDLAFAGRVEVRPWLRVDSATNTFDLQAFASLREFSDENDTEERFGAASSFEVQVDPRTSIRFGANVDSSNGQLGSRRLDEPVDEDTGVPIPQFDPVTGEDITLFGGRGRVTNWGVDVGLVTQVSERGTVTAGAGFDSYDVSGARGGEDYNSYFVNLGAQHQIDAETAIGINGGLRKTDYDTDNAGDATTVTGLVNLNRRFGSEWDLNVSGGVAATDIDDVPLQPGRNIVTFTADATLCGRNARRSFCIDYRRSPEPTTLGTIRNTDAFGMSFFENITNRDRVNFSANYSRAGEDVVGPNAVSAVEYASVSSSFERTFSRQLDGFIFGSVSRIYRDDFDADASVSFGVGVRLRFGDPR